LSRLVLFPPRFVGTVVPDWGFQIKIFRDKRTDWGGLPFLQHRWPDVSSFVVVIVVMSEVVTMTRILRKLRLQLHVRFGKTDALPGGRGNRRFVRLELAVVCLVVDLLLLHFHLRSQYASTISLPLIVQMSLIKLGSRGVSLAVRSSHFSTGRGVIYAK
jgi:hypothetical protein